MSRPTLLAVAHGSSHPAAAGELLAHALAATVVAAFAAAGRPTVHEAVARLRAEAGGPVAVASYLLAPGRFHDRLAAARPDSVTAPLADHPAVAALVIDRYRVAVQAARPRRPAPAQ